MNESLNSSSSLERKWADKNQQELMTLLQDVPFPQLKIIAEYLSTKINYATFIRYLRSTGSTYPEYESLLEVAEQAIDITRKSVLDFEEIWSEMPEDFKTIDLDSELLKRFETQVKDLKDAALELISRLQEFIDGQYLNAADLHPMFNSLCKLYEEFFVQTKLLLNTVLLNIRNLNQSIESEDLYKEFLASLSASEQATRIEIGCEITVVASYPGQRASSPESSLAISVDMNVIDLDPIRFKAFQSIPISDLFLFRRVNSKWRTTANAVVNLILENHGATEDQVRLFHSLPSYLQYVIVRRITELHDNEKLQSLFIALNADLQQRKASFTLDPRFGEGTHAAVFSDVGVTLHYLDIFPGDEIHHATHTLYSQYGALILVDKLISKDKVENFWGVGSTDHNNLPSITSKNGYVALRTGLLVADGAHDQTDLDVLLSDSGLELLKKGALTHRQARGFYQAGSQGPYANLRAFLSPGGLTALRERFITPDDAPYIPNLDDLVSERGLSALREGLIIARGAPSLLLSDNGLEALRLRILSQEDAISMEEHNLKTLLSDGVFQFLKKGYITAAQAKHFIPPAHCIHLFDRGLISFSSFPGDKIKSISDIPLASLSEGAGLMMLEKKLIKTEDFENNHKLRQLICERGLEAMESGAIKPSSVRRLNFGFEAFLHELIYDDEQLKILEEGLVTLDQLATFEHPFYGVCCARALFTQNGAKALRAGLFTVEQASKIYDLSNLVSDEGITALQTGLITIEETFGCYRLDILTIPNGVLALKERLITLKQAQLRGDSSKRALFSDVGLQALRDGLITPDVPATFFHSGNAGQESDNLSDLLTPLGIRALQLKLVDPMKASRTNLRLMFSSNNDPIILKALELKLVSLEDFQYNGKFYQMSVSQINTAMNELVKPYSQGPFNVVQASTSIIPQSFFQPACVQSATEPNRSVQTSPPPTKPVTTQQSSGSVKKIAHDKLSTRIIPFLIANPSLLRPFTEQFQLKDYERAVWELCHIKHEVVSQMLAIMLECGINLNKKFGRDEQSALHVAARMESAEIYSLLVASGADENLLDGAGRSPKSYLTKTGAVELM